MRAPLFATLSLLLLLGSTSLLGCVGSGSSAQSSTPPQTNSASVSSESDEPEDEQDDCYGNDLPARKS